MPALTSTEPGPLPVPRIRLAESPFVLTYVGLGARRDRLEQIVAIAAALVEKGLPVRLQLLGLSGAAQRDATDLARARHLDGTSISGWVTREALEAAMQASDAFIFLRGDDLSGRSAFPTRLPELMLTGRPVICSRVGDIPLYLHDGQDLLFVDGPDVERIATRVTSLARTEGALAALGTRGALAAVREFDYRPWGRRLMAFMEDAAADTRNPAVQPSPHDPR